jgi:tRNA-(ms[2]io[6]A)-hydroxylase
MFIDLAKFYFDENVVKNRWKDFLEFEAGVMRQLELRGDRMH